MSSHEEDWGLEINKNGQNYTLLWSYFREMARLADSRVDATEAAALANTPPLVFD